MKEKFGGITIRDGEIQHKDGRGPIAAARASVETAGDIERRITATRLVLTGPFALAFRKKRDHREMFLTVEGQGFAFVEPVDPKKQADARKFAARINALASSSRAAPASATPPPPPQAEWRTDPTGAHELRYWDGNGWTDHVSDGGVNSTAPMAAVASPTAVDLANQIRKLGELRDQGLLTEEEFSAQKAKLLNG